ncbi:putative DNA repair protein [Aspergillus mulundensis]|uniref:DNA repair metallo-beta-lactamase domain-containing protein n=1 Tax=Aspergillus mulundensis TaxID=1810919 RepID=A0A3D8R990_9EURO|nr:hypothetical protein DSM5745_08130 [Aspergillus mulundensis]RDW70619.1 hypothetical protein DSM5745_08130 [Aspergillus mulundensis]
MPLNTPTEIDLTPKLSIRVTLLDANHCTGAVMFLIEGDGKAILYTGDIRAESWWVDGLIRHPVLIPYTLGNKRLDKIYLDTTFAHTSHTFHTFPTKAEGIAELLRKLEPYPEDTTFYFRAWTFGYEEVWMALAAALNSKIHADRYQIGLYNSVSRSGTFEAPSLCGFGFGNRLAPGCLSEDQSSRIHSCEPGVHCPVATSKKTVYITPIVSRTDKGAVLPELGAGGGLGDLYQIHELELPDQSSLAQLEQLCSEKIQDPQALSKAKEALLAAFNSKTKVLSLNSYGMKDAHQMPLDELVNVLSRGRLGEESLPPEKLPMSNDIVDKYGRPLPRTIRFPYSRHSSYAELCELIKAFKPRDIHPCTVDPLDWDEDISMQSIFGQYCSGNVFVHDQYMREMLALENGERPRKRRRRDPRSPTPSTQHSTLVTENGITSQASRVSHIPIRVAPAKDGTGSASQPHNQLPSSLPMPPLATIPQTFEPSSPYNDSSSLPIPALSPDTVRARRETVRQARDHLKDVQKPQSNQLHLGSLPASWPTDEESIGLHASFVEAQDLQGLDARSVSSQVTAIHEPVTGRRDTSYSRFMPTSPAQPRAQVPSTSAGVQNGAEDVEMTGGPDPGPNTILESDNEDNISDSATNAEHETHQHPPSQHSVSSSTFASQSQSQNQNQSRVVEGLEDEIITDDDEYTSDADALGHPHAHPDPDPDPDPQLTLPMDLKPGSSKPRPPLLSRRESSIRNRRAAYEAAREDSFDAWAEMSLVSAGNNHTEEEVEL